jgi:hypothetical protein
MSHAADAGDTTRQTSRGDQDRGDQGSAVSGDRSGRGKVRKAGLFDIRTFIAALLGFDGIVILLMGLFGDQSTTTEAEPPININLWAGLGLVIAAILFETWKRLRPVKVVEPPPDAGDRPAHH